MPKTTPVLQSMNMSGGRAGSLWHHADFLKLWAGQTLSLFGTPFTSLAVQIIAVVTLRATPGLAVPLLLLSSLLGNLGWVVYGVNEVSLRQVITSPTLLGRVNATMSFIYSGILPLGALASGALAQVLGMRPAITLAAFAGLLAFLWIAFSPVRNLVQVPEAAAES